MSVKEQLAKELGSIIKKMGGDFTLVVEAPSDLGHGDYTSNIAMVLAKKLSKNPMEIAEEIVTKIKDQKSKIKTTTQNLNLNLFERIEVVKPGFINFWLSQSYLVKFLGGSVAEKKDGIFAKKKIMVEFTDPNPFKEFHIGHLYSNIVGEAISRLLESQGAEVWRVCYQGDVGLHVAKALWGIINLRDSMPDDSAPLEDRVAFLGKAYALGVKEYEINLKVKEDILVLNKKIYAKDASIIELYQRGRAWSLDYFDDMYERLGTSFKKFYFESEVGEYGASYIKDNIGKVFKKSDGAVVFPGDEYGLHTRVFINSQGLPTYEAKELGLAPTKYKDFPYDVSIIITGNEINEYFKVLLKALSLVNSELAAKTRHISHGMVRLPSGKMSSRTGDVITAKSLLDEAYEKAWNKIQEVTKTEFKGEYAYYAKGAKVLPSKQMPTAKLVGDGAVKYALLKGNIGSDIVFNFEESISFEGNAGPYLQYTYVRTQSVLRKSKIQNSKSQTASNAASVNHKFQISLQSGRQANLKLEEEELTLLRLLVRFGGVVAEAGERLAPNVLCNYLFVLAQAFNLFYQKLPILTPIESGLKGKEEVRDFRLALTEATGKVIRSGLELLGIEAPERM